MNKTLLVNRVNPQNYTKQKKTIFILIGDINISSVENKLIDTLNESNLLEKDDILYKYNGVELKIDVQTIPTIIKLLAEEDFSIYSVFEIYNPEL